LHEWLPQDFGSVKCCDGEPLNTSGTNSRPRSCARRRSREPIPALNATRYSTRAPPTRRKSVLKPTTQQVSKKKGGAKICPSISSFQRARKQPGSTRRIRIPFSRGGCPTPTQPKPCRCVARRY
jgi:hypothetical protein